MDFYVELIISYQEHIQGGSKFLSKIDWNKKTIPLSFRCRSGQESSFY